MLFRKEWIIAEEEMYFKCSVEKFKQGFKGDEFNVYRSIPRSINPSPYLFYFDYGTLNFLVLLRIAIPVRDNQTVAPMAVL